MALPLFAQGAFAASPNDTPETIARKRALIAAMMPKFGSAKFVGEGIGQLATGVVIGRQNKKLDAAEAAGRQSAAELFERMISGAGNTSYSTSGGGTPSGTWTPAPPPPSPVDIATTGMDVAKSGGLTFGADMPKADPGVFGAGKEKLDFGAAVMTPQEMLIEGAKARNLDPVDVATAISYETGGTFNPTIRGPTTQWGTHDGLIQFGDPQGEKYGLDLSSEEAAWRSQLNPTSGAVWRYLEDTGVKPGMGLPEIYSAINAGSVGRMNASDANNGGAPGTVADKVASMGPHREKAAAFLGGTWTPDPNAPQGQTTTVSTKGTGGGISTNDLLAAMANPWLDPQQRAILTGMYEDQVRQADPMYQAQVRKAELELAQLENPNQTPEEVTGRMLTLDSLGIDKNSPEGQAYILTGKWTGPGGEESTSYGTTLQFFTGKDGKLRAGVIGNDGTMKEVPPPDGGDWAAGVDRVDAGTKWIFYDKRSGQMVGEEPKDLRGAESEKALGQAEGEAAGEAVTGLGNALAKGEQALSLIDQIAEDPALPSILGIVQGNLAPGTPLIGGGQAGADLGAKIEQLQGQVFLEAFESLKGAGQITEIEGQKAEKAKARLQRTQSPEAYRAALAELRAVIEGGMRRAQEKAGKAGGSAPATGGKRTLKYNPATDSFE